MNKLTNLKQLGLSMAVWLAHDEYSSGADEHPDKNVISATALLKPTRRLVLESRLTPEEQTVDVADLIPSRFGHAIHDSVEHAWVKGYRKAMKRLGYPQKVIDRVCINPEDDTVDWDDIIPVYLEQRFFRPITVDGNEIIISGKFDQIINGELNDTKSTSVYAYINRSKEEDYRIQGSIYRWINPTKVTSDLMRIQHVFTDWQRAQAKANNDYPQSRVVEFTVELMSLQETEAWIASKLREIILNQERSEEDLVRCTPKELWMSDPVWKFYSDPKKATEGGRSTKNFSNYPAAAAHRNKVGKGVIIEVPSKPKACGYCPAFPICTQKDEYEHD